MITFLLTFVLCIGAIGFIGFGFVWGAIAAHRTIALDCQHLGGFRTVKAVYSAYRTKDIIARNDRFTFALACALLQSGGSPVQRGATGLTLTLIR